MPTDIAVPQSYLDMPGWWHGHGAGWLADLPRTIERQLRTWRLTPSGEVMHGSNALVIPVIRDGADAVLRLSYPDDRTTDEIVALRFWDGRGAVRLLDADPSVAALLLERIRPGTAASELPVPECMRVMGRMMRRLAVGPVPSELPSTGDLVSRRRAELEPLWERFGRPFPVELLRRVEAAAGELSIAAGNLAVDGDLHAAQVLRAEREPWLAVDLLLYRGDIEYDLARILWDRIDEMPTDADVVQSLETVVTAAGLDRDRARTWVLFRTVDYWLWGLAHGLTEDPARCERLVSALGFR